jgi:SnoaL-like domain
VADRTELTKQFIALQNDSKFDEAVAMLSDDVTSTNPMTGTVTGKAAVEAGMRNRPAGFTIEWAEPKADGDTVSSVGTGLPFGPIKMILNFNAEDKIDKIDIGMGA